MLDSGFRERHKVKYENGKKYEAGGWAAETRCTTWEEKTHNVRGVSTKEVTELQTHKSQLRLRLKQSKSKIEYLEQRQRIKDHDEEKKGCWARAKKESLTWVGIRWSKSMIQKSEDPNKVIDIE